MTPAQAQPVIVRLPAEIDMVNAESIGEELAAMCGPGVAVVIADMTATTFCDSMGVRMLVLARRQAVTGGTDLRLVLPGPHVLRVMKILGVDAVLPIYRSVDEALSGLMVMLSGTCGA